MSFVCDISVIKIRQKMAINDSPACFEYTCCHGERRTGALLPKPHWLSPYDLGCRVTSHHKNRFRPGTGWSGCL